MLPIPSSLLGTGGAGSTPAGQAWLQRLPELVARAQERWQLALDEPFGVGTASWTAPGRSSDGTPVVLKISFPHNEASYEAIVLNAWRGRAAVELLDHNPEDWALLMRRAHPGTPLLMSAASPAERIDICLGVLANLHTAPLRAIEIPSLRETCGTWAEVTGTRLARWSGVIGEGVGLVEHGIATLHALRAATYTRVLLHGDMNPGNVILDDPGIAHWLAIDPKPMAGDPAYDVWPVLSQIDDPFAYPDPIPVALPRVHRAASVLGLEPRRICQWGLARTVESVLWQLDTWQEPDRQQAALGGLREAHGWARLLEIV